MRKHRGFTLMEIMIVVILISVIAAFGLPAYNKSVDRASEKHAITQLKLIWGGIQLYKARTGDWPTETLDGVSAINQALNLSIIPVDFLFECHLHYHLYGEYGCSATSTDEYWRLFFWSSAQFIACDGAACPSCPGEWQICASI